MSLINTYFLSSVSPSKNSISDCFLLRALRQVSKLDYRSLAFVYVHLHATETAIWPGRAIFSNQTISGSNLYHSMRKFQAIITVYNLYRLSQKRVSCCFFLPEAGFQIPGAWKMQLQRAISRRRMGRREARASGESFGEERSASNIALAAVLRIPASRITKTNNPVERAPSEAPIATGANQTYAA